MGTGSVLPRISDQPIVKLPQLLQMFNGAWSPLQVPYLLAVFAVATTYFFALLNNILSRRDANRRQDPLLTLRNLAMIFAFGLNAGAVLIVCMAAQAARDYVSYVHVVSVIVSVTDVFQGF